jgi:OPT oligopeptide transporter protein
MLAFSLSALSIATSGTVLTFLWCPRNPSITPEWHNVSKIINADSSLNIEAYKAYSPLFLPVSFAMSYGLSFATITATLTHTFLYYHKRIWTQARGSIFERPDIHARLMSVYKEVPDWWYLTIFGLWANSYYKVRECTHTFQSDHVCVWCRCHRGVGHPVAYMGLYSCRCHPYVCLTWS